MPDLHGNLWIGTRDHGIYQVDTKTLSYRNISSILGKEFFHDRVISTLYRGSSGITWVGTRYDGVHKIVPSTKNFIQHESGSLDKSNGNYGVITVILMDQEGNKWIGTRNDGLARIDVKTGIIRIYRKSDNGINSLSSNNILAICPASEGKKSVFWIGTDGGGLNRFDPSTGSCLHYKKDVSDETSLSNDHVYAILDYDADHLLIGTWGITTSGGLDLFNKKTGRFINFQ